MTVKSIWSTPEAEAWARNFDYENYLTLHVRMGIVAAVLSEEGYEAICAVFEVEMVKEIG